MLHTIPLFHVNGWGTPHYVTGLGGVHVMLPRFDSTEVLRLVEAERVTRLYLVPAMMTALLNDPSFDSRDLSSVQQLSVGGAPTPPALLAEAERRFGCECICGYGMTESGPQMTKAIDKPGEPTSARRRSTTGHADPRRRPAHLRRRRPRAAVGRRDRRARSGRGRTT